MKKKCPTLPIFRLLNCPKKQSLTKKWTWMAETKELLRNLLL